MNVVAIKPAKPKRQAAASTAPAAPVTRSKTWLRKMARQRGAAYGIGAVAVVLMGLSLSHLASGVLALTHGEEWHAWAMAVGIDAGFIGLELGQLCVSTETMRKTVAKWAEPTIIGTLIVSAIMNAYAFASTTDNLAVACAACALGISIPSLIYVLTRVSVALWLDTQKG
jgi:MFS family permease